MNLIIGSIVVIVCVFGGFMAHGGQLLAIWQPYELVIIGGAAIGAFVIANPKATVFKVLKAIPAMMKGSRYKRTDYVELLRFMFALFTKARKDGMLAIEADIDDPDSSELFQTYPGLLEAFATKLHPWPSG